MRKIEKNGIKIVMEDDARELQYYIQNHLSRDEFDTIFGHAKHKGQSFFQDDDRKHFCVTFDDGVYAVSEV